MKERRRMVKVISEINLIKRLQEDDMELTNKRDGERTACKNTIKKLKAELKERKAEFERRKKGLDQSFTRQWLEIIKLREDLKAAEQLITEQQDEIELLKGELNERTAKTN